MGTLKDELVRLAGVDLEEHEHSAAREAAQRRLAPAEARARAHFEAALRYPGAEPLSLAEAQAILDAVAQPPANASVDGVFDPATWLDPSVQRIAGPVELDELHLRAEGSNLFVQGDLRVRGVLQQDFRAGGLLVLGNLEADHIVTTGEIACTGSLTVAGTFFGNCTNYCTNVWGLTRASVVVVAKEHYLCPWGGLEAQIILDTESTPNLGELASATGEEVDEWLAPGVDPYDESGVAAWLREHGSVLRADRR